MVPVLVVMIVAFDLVTHDAPKGCPAIGCRTDLVESLT
jgi:hypothetical protein